MKIGNAFSINLALILTSFIVLISCKKEAVNSTGNPTSPTNKLPVAHAGSDITVNYDLQTCKIDLVNLDGRNSTDLDGKIVHFSWSGPGLISNPDSAITQVRLLSTGLYQFILFVTDDKDGFDTDTMVVNVVSLMNRPTINAQLIPFATLSQARAGIAVASAGNKILFAGSSGNSGQTNSSTRVDIYDMATNSWSITELSVKRQDFAVVTSGNKIFFAGGWEGYWWEEPSMFTNVDIYDAVTNSWSVKYLSERRAFIGAASAGNKVFFAGGYGDGGGSSKVDIYDTGTNSWSTSSLSEARSHISTQLAGDKIYFAGGAIDYEWTPRATIDVYDVNTGLWSVSSMSEPKYNMKSCAIGSKIFWAGGYSGNYTSYAINYTSLMVEIKDANTQSSSPSCLHEAEAWWDNDQKAVVKNNQIIFFAGSGNGAPAKFDIYDIASNSWSIGVLNQNLVGASIISVNNTIYIAGGYLNGTLSNVVWKLEF